MAGNKSKAAGSKGKAGPPPVDSATLQRAQKQYQTAFGRKAKGLIAYIEEHKKDTSFINRLSLLRLVNAKRDELKKHYEEILKDKPDAAPAAVAKLLQGVLEAAAGCEQPLEGDERCSLGIVSSRASLLAYVLKEVTPEAVEQQQEALAYVEQYLQKGLTKDSWSKVWFDPKTELLVGESKDVKEMESKQPVLLAAEQVKELTTAHKLLYLTLMRISRNPGSDQQEAAQQALEGRMSLQDVMQLPWYNEMTAVLESAKGTQAEQQHKQLEAKMLAQQQQGSKAEQQQQQLVAQRGRGNRDTERSKDSKRGKQAPDDKLKQEELDRARQEEQKIKEEARNVLAFLQAKVLREGMQDTKQHLAALQEQTTVKVEHLMGVARDLHNQVKDAKDSKADPRVVQLWRAQLGDPMPTEQQLKGQLEALRLRDAWQLYLDEAPAAGLGKSSKRTWEDWDTFREHVGSQHMAISGDQVKELCHKDGPDLQRVFELQLQSHLADDAAEQLRLGVDDEPRRNPWLEAFKDECPLKRFIRSYEQTVTEELLAPSVITNEADAEDPDCAKQSRLYAAGGFALLQMERGMVNVDMEELSYKPRWVVLAFYTLKLMLAIHEAGFADNHDFVTFNFWRSKHACKREYRRIMQPHTFDCAEDSEDAQPAANGPSTSSAQATFTDSLPADNATMLHMLARDGLLQGLLLLALQVFLVRAGVPALDLSSSSEGYELDRTAATATLVRLSAEQQLELRQFLLQVLYNTFSSLDSYRTFLRKLLEERERNSQVPVVVEERGGTTLLSLNPKYYEQACLAAAMPRDLHDACCSKHTSSRAQAEADGKTFSRFDDSLGYEAFVCDEIQASGITQADEGVIERYLLQPARVAQAAAEKELRVGTVEGLEALVNQLFGVHEHEPHCRLTAAAAGDEASSAGKRTVWDKVVTDLTAAAELALHREQLQALIADNEQVLLKNHGQLSKREGDQRTRALLTQRVAGQQSVVYMFMNRIQKQQEELKEEERNLLDQLKQLSDVALDKGAKGGKEKDSRDKEEKIQQKLNQITISLNTCETGLTSARGILSRLCTEAEGYSDLIRAYYSTETGETNTLVQMIKLLSNELLSTAQHNAEAAARQLREALQLARLSLFDMEVALMHNVVAARDRVFASMWKHKQPAVVVLLSLEALKNILREGISKSAEADLLEMVLAEESKGGKQDAQGKAKKKKKKGAAAKPKQSLMQRIAGSDEGEDDEQAEAAAAAPAEPEQQKEEEEEEEQEEQEAAAVDDGWGSPQQQEEGGLDLNGMNIKVDFEKLIYDVASTKQQQQHQQTDSNSSSSQGRAAGSQAAAAGAAAAGRSARPAAAAGAAPAAAAGRPSSAASSAATAGGRGGSRDSAAAPAGGCASSQTGGRKYLYYGPVPNVCAKCGECGHRTADCKAPYCRSCDKVGHAAGECGQACRQCGKFHTDRDRGFCRIQCNECGLYGHKASECPSRECRNCGLLGHTRNECQACSFCKEHGHPPAKCPGWCDKCKQAGHWARDCTAKRCVECGEEGHVPGMGMCYQKSAPPSAAAAGGRGSSSRAAPAAPAAAAAAVAAAAPARGAAAAAGRRVEPFRPANVALEKPAKSKEEDAQRRTQFMSALFGKAEAYAATLLEQDDKLSLLTRLSQADLASILESPNPEQLLDDVYKHSFTSSTGSLPPCELSQQLADELEALLPPKSLPAGWRQVKTWDAIQKAVSDVRRVSLGEAKRLVKEARERAVLAVAEQQKQQQPGKQPLRQQQQPASRRGSVPERRPSTDRGERPSSGSRTAGQQGSAVPAPAPAVDRPAAVSFKSVQQAGAAAAGQAGAAGDAAAAAAVPTAPPSSLPAALSGHPMYRALSQEQQQPAQASVPPSAVYATPAAAAVGQQPSWAPSLPPQLPLAHLGPPAAQQVPDFRGPLAPWMMWYAQGAMRGIHELVQDEQIRDQLLAVVHNTPEAQLAPTLEDALTGLIKQVVSNVLVLDGDASHSLAQLADVVRAAAKEGKQQPPMMPLAPQAGVLGLPPHLQYAAGQQGPYGAAAAAAAMLPPHFQQQQQQWSAGPPGVAAVQQQQQQPADDGEESDDDALLGLLTASDTGAAQQQQQEQGRTGWASVAGGQQQAGYQPGFPALGASGAAQGEDDMQRAMAESMQDQQRSSSSSGGRHAAPAVSAAGLANETGEYNCFLNVVVQCLWSCRDFRVLVLELPTHQATHPVVQALIALFQQMKTAESGWQPGHDRAVVNPTELREALDKAAHFRRQEMNDANELLDTLYECFKKAQAPGDVPGSRGVLINSVFGLQLNESVRCNVPGCGKQTHVIPSHWEHMLVVNTMALTFAAYDCEEANPSMGRLLRTLFDQEQKMCDKDHGGCGTFFAPERECEAAPCVLTLQLVWNQDLSGQEIGDTLNHVQEDLDILPLYAGGCSPSSTTYRLSSTVAYYGQHYMAFVFNPKLNTWLLFDDASVSAVGTWQDVIKKCVTGKIQPSVLFYQVMDLQAMVDGGSAAAPVPAPAPAHAAPVPAAAPAHAPVPAHSAPVPAAAPGGVPAWGNPGPGPVHHHHGQQRLHPAAASAPHPPAAAPGAVGGWPAAAAARSSSGMMDEGVSDGRYGRAGSSSAPAAHHHAWGIAPPAAAAAGTPAGQPHAGPPATAAGPAPAPGASPVKVSFAGRGSMVQAAAARAAASAAGRGPRTTGPPSTTGPPGGAPREDAWGGRGVGRGRG